MLIDSHCHIEDDETALRAYTAGVTAMLNAGKDLDESDAQIAMCQRFNAQNGTLKMWTSAGIHPDSAPEKLNKIQIEDIIAQTNHSEVIAIGECGLDYHYGAEYKNEQKEMFKRHIESAGLTNLPIMIHQREAENDMLELLQKGKLKYPELTGVIHCFTSNADFAAAVKELGFYISASGIITFKSAADIAAVFKSYPLDKILIETDSPYLAPVPYRGKINEPAYIIKTAEKLAEIRGLKTEEIAAITRENFYRLYTKAKEGKICQK
jgi:TatD DNase family protein